MVRQFAEEHSRRVRLLSLRRRRGLFDKAQARRIYGTVATGEIFHPILEEKINELNARFGTRLTAAKVPNVFFGAGVTVAGLLSGIDFMTSREHFGGEFLMVPSDCYRQHDERFLDGMTVGELAGELALPVIRSWNDLLGIRETKEEKHLPVLSHNYGSVTSVSI